jgi:hypothetical protein
VCVKEKEREREKGGRMREKESRECMMVGEMEEIMATKQHSKDKLGMKNEVVRITSTKEVLTKAFVEQ